MEQKTKNKVAVQALENFIKLIKKDKISLEIFDVEELIIDNNGITLNELVIGFKYNKDFDTLVSKINKGN